MSGIKNQLNQIYYKTRLKIHTNSRDQNSVNYLRFLIWFEGILTHQKYPWKSYHAIGLLSPSRYWLDLFKEILWISVAQRAAKLLPGKHWGWYNYSWLELGLHASGSTRAGEEFFLKPPTLIANITLQPFDL